MKFIVWANNCNRKRSKFIVIYYIKRSFLDVIPMIFREKEVAKTSLDFINVIPELLL